MAKIVKITFFCTEAVSIMRTTEAQRIGVRLVGTILNRMEQLAHIEQLHVNQMVLQKQSTFL